jgi:hypothetical protein
MRPGGLTTLLNKYLWIHWSELAERKQKAERRKNRIYKRQNRSQETTLLGSDFVLQDSRLE